MSLSKSIFQEECAEFLHLLITGPAFRTLLHFPTWLQHQDDLPSSRGALARLDSGCHVLNVLPLLREPNLPIFVNTLLSSLSPSSNTVECGLCDRRCAGAGRTYLLDFNFLRAVFGSQQIERKIHYRGFLSTPPAPHMHSLPYYPHPHWTGPCVQLMSPCGHIVITRSP